MKVVVFACVQNAGRSQMAAGFFNALAVTDDLDPELRDYFATVRVGEVVGAVGLEPCGAVALFRSLVVAPAHRAPGMGRSRASLANTREDGLALPALAAAIPIRTRTQLYPLEQANEALLNLKQDRVKGAAVLAMR
jgi:D-arabinose 1-dehydrogenase-like Zn-dependent alcohol dehydrogenase